jgi:hypothetical protein
MLALILDENISSVIAEQVALRRPEIPIQSIFHWRSGMLTRHPDHLILRAAAEDGLTLVTYDVNTILPLITEWGASDLTHEGVIFVHQWTIRSDDFGGLIRALEWLWDQEHQQVWTNRTRFLDRAP